MVSEKADLVLHEGIIMGHPESDSVAITGERIAAHGRYSEIKSHIGPRTHMLRLGGRVLAPGFIDCHQHFMEGAAVAAGLSLVRCRTIGDLLSDLRVSAAKTPPGNWLRAFGCDEALVRERRSPTRAELDWAVPKNPLRLRHQTLHASWLNSRAISALGLESPKFVAPDGAQMVRDATGRLSGLMVGMEEWLSARLPRVTAAEMEARARSYSCELAANGITAFTDATVRNGPEEIATFARLIASGALRQRLAMMVGPQYLKDLHGMRRTAEASGIQIIGVKFMHVARYDPVSIARTVISAFERGADCAFHVTEVEELDTVVRACQQAAPHLTQSGNCLRIEHGGLIPPEYPEQIAALGAWVVTNPGFIYYRGAKYAADPGLIGYLYPNRTLARAGVMLAAGTDAPVTPAKPLHGIAAAMARISLEGYELARQEELSTDNAFALFTKNAAELSRLPAGEIMTGGLADLVVLPADPRMPKPAELINLTVETTIVGGQVIYEKGRPLFSQAAGLPLFF
ncbi:MAG TPA: amidohydrolase family protein [Candidatus Binataceae bacterium]|nr:amidohydrolase family protein [Candidatus Binataceae bacterium]